MISDERGNHRTPQPRTNVQQRQQEQAVPKNGKGQARTAKANRGGDSARDAALRAVSHQEDSRFHPAFIHSFIHKYMPSNYQVPGPAVGAGDTVKPKNYFL